MNRKQKPLKIETKINQKSRKLQTFQNFISTVVDLGSPLVKSIIDLYNGKVGINRVGKYTLLQLMQG
jgi:hypothetical protein